MGRVRGMFFNAPKVQRFAPVRPPAIQKTILICGQIPLPECQLAPCSVALTHSWSESAPTQAPVLREESSLVWPYRLLPCIRCTQGLSSALERYKIYSVPLPVRKPVSKQDLETTQLSVTESAETQLCVPQNISKGITAHLLGKKWLGDYMYPGGPVSGKCDLIYAVEKSQVPRQFYQCTYNNSMITVTPDVIYLLSFLDLIFAGTLKTKKLEPNSTNWDIAQCSEQVSQNIWVSHMSWGQISTKLVREVFMHFNCCSLCQLMQEAKESS